MKTSRTAFLSILESVQPGLANKEIVEHTNSFIFTGGMVMTWNDEISVRHPLPDSLQTLEGAVKSAELYSLLKRYRSETIDVCISDNEFRVATPNSQAAVALEPEVPDFVHELDVPPEESELWHDLPEEFESAVRFCRYSVSADMTRPALSCLHFVEDRVESTDSFRITIFELSDKVPDEFLVPNMVLKEVLKHKFYTYCTNEGWLHLGAENGVVFSCRVPESDFPDLLRFLDDEGVKFQLPEGLDDVVERAVVFVNEEDFETDKFVQITAAKGLVLVSSKGPNGWFKERLKSAYKGEQFSFTINPSWLQDAYALLHSCVLTKNFIRLEGANFVHLVTLRSEG